MRKKLFLFAIALTMSAAKLNACEWYDADGGYFNLFSQEIMNDSRYRPFLLTFENRYYPHETLRNGNIEEWQAFLGLSYDDTKYLVFNSSREDLQLLTKGKAASDSRLAFATPEFVKKHKQALLYLAYSKYLEPYMRIIPGESEDEYGYWWFDDCYEHNAGELDYNKVKTVLTKSWAAESALELKLRYGYQLVRLAHYTRRYAEAVQLFEEYVEPLGLKTEMYYYALSQKAGALRGLGETEMANRDFIRVFANSIDLKVSACTSMSLGWNHVNYNDFVAGAADDNERNDIYFLMGYGDFSNPCNEIAKIVANNPDAIQAKVLMIRAINEIEREMLCTYCDLKDLESFDGDRRYPSVFSIDDLEILRPFMDQAIGICDQQRKVASDKNFWYLASSYLHFLNKDFEQASDALANVKSSDELYMNTVNNLIAYIDICRQPKLTPQVERDLFAKYDSYIKYDEFIAMVLTNRYLLQGEKAKSFFVTNPLKAVEDDPNEDFLDEILSFFHKKKKTPMEEYFMECATHGIANPDNYIAYVRGVLRLTQGDFNTALSCFEKQTRLRVSKRIFGHNIRVWFSGEEEVIMREDYLNEFPFIHDGMSEADVTDALIQLKKIGEKNTGDYSAKAYYLISNFFYNVSEVGYFRHYLRFDNNNAFWSKYDSWSPYQSTLPLAEAYLAKAEKAATDRELKAHIAFANAKYAQNDLEPRYSYNVVFSREDFDAFEQYQKTNYYDDVISNCVYFEYYHNGVY